jgi:hypothetical protein
MNPEKCIRLKAAKQSLADFPSIEKVECGGDKCNLVVGYSKKGKALKGEGIPNVLSGAARCSKVASEAASIQNNMERSYYPTPEITLEGLRSKLKSLIKEAKELGILEDEDEKLI